VLDSIGKDTLARSYGVVKKGEDHCFTRCAPGIRRNWRNMAFAARPFSVDPNSDELSEIGKTDRRQENQRDRVAKRFPLSEARKAQEQVATGHTRGKIVLKGR